MVIARILIEASVNKRVNFSILPVYFQQKLKPDEPYCVRTPFKISYNCRLSITRTAFPSVVGRVPGSTKTISGVTNVSERISA